MALVAIVSLADLASGRAAATDPVCAQRTDLKGTCFEARGVLAVSDGTPSARISLPGGRVLGVEPFFADDNETLSAPKAVRDMIGVNHSMAGDFLVCPLDQPSEHRMRTVCIESMQPLASGQR